MTVYKLTNEQMETRNGTKWEIGKEKSIEKNKQSSELCSDGVLHAYNSVELALLLNPIHANILNVRLFEADAHIVVSEWDKCGAHKMILTKELDVPGWYKNKKVSLLFAIKCAKEVLHIFEQQWPDDNRPRLATEAAERYIKNPTQENRMAASAAADAAYAAAASTAAAYAAIPAYAAAAAAYADHAAAAAIKICFLKLAKESIKEAQDDD